MFSKHMKRWLSPLAISDLRHIFLDPAYVRTVPRFFLKKISYINAYINAYENVKIGCFQILGYFW